ncbi:Hypothetical protein ACI5QN_01085 [Bacillus cereus]
MICFPSKLESSPHYFSFILFISLVFSQARIKKALTASIHGSSLSSTLKRCFLFLICFPSKLDSSPHYFSFILFISLVFPPGENKKGPDRFYPRFGPLFHLKKMLFILYLLSQARKLRS